MKDLLSCCEGHIGEIKDGLEVMMSVPKKANDAMHLSMLEGLEDNLEALGEVFLQDQFLVWDPKQLIRKGRERHLFLFDMCLIFAKEVKDSNGKSKYMFKFKLMIPDLNITEHIEGDETKFALWTGRAPISDYRIILKTNNLETKQNWVKKLRELMQERMTYMHEALRDKPPTLFKPTQAPKAFHTATKDSLLGFSRKDLEGDTSFDDLPIERRGSLTSMTSIATTATSDSSSSGGTKPDVTVVIENYSAANNSEITVLKGQQVEVIDPTPGEPNWCMVRAINCEDGEPCQGLVPIASLKPIPMLRVPGSRNSMDIDEAFGDEQNSITANQDSPANKRKSSFRKWLAPGRKKSQTKLEKPPIFDEIEKRVFMGTLGTRHDQIETQPHNDQVSMVSQKKSLEVAEDDAEDIELPPPMKIQEHLFGTAAQEETSEDMAKKLASTLTLQDTGNALTDLENMVKQRMDPSHENPFDHQLSSESGGDTADDQTQELTEEEKEKYRQKRKFVMQELFDTEKDYVKDLGLIIEGYMEYLKEHGMPEDLQGKDKIVFGNIHQIYDWHRETFLPEVEKCVDDVDQIASIFTRYERRLYMYVKYCENKPKSEFIVTEYIEVFEDIRQKLGHRLTLPDILIKPVQRIMKYQLLLRDIQKYTDRAGEDTKTLKRALEVMCVVPKAANDMMQVGRLQGFDGKITAQGKLLLQDTLSVSELTQGQSQPKFKERRVFLFEQIIIFSEMSEKKRGILSNANYVYKNSIKVNNMALTKVVEGEPLRFMLINKTPGSDCRFVIQAPSDAVKHTWTLQITSLLDMQGDFLRALQSPIEYQNKVKKEIKC